MAMEIKSALKVVAIRQLPNDKECVVLAPEIKYPAALCVVQIVVPSGSYEFNDTVYTKVELTKEQIELTSESSST